MWKVTRRKQARARREWNRDRRASMHGGGYVRDWLHSSDRLRHDTYVVYGRRRRTSTQWGLVPVDLLPPSPLFEVDGVRMMVVSPIRVNPDELGIPLAQAESRWFKVEPSPP